MISIRVPAADAGRRLDVVVAGLTGWSRTQVAAAIDADRIALDGVRARRSQKVSDGAVITVTEPETSVVTVDAPDAPPMLFRDDDVLVINKPAGLVVHQGAGHTGDTLVDALTAAGVPLASAAGAGREGMVHRLDRDTSGALLVASTDEAYVALVAAISARRVVRRYLALVAGVPVDARGRIEGPIGREDVNRQRFAITATGKPAVTRYRAMASARVLCDGNAEDVSLLELTLETGRTHQIRVHLEALGHPVVGDPWYGNDQSARLARALGISRCALHAWQLEFDHPISQAPMALTAPLPADFLGALSAAGLGHPDGSTANPTQ